jgi:hypothetical protein
MAIDSDFIRNISVLVLLVGETGIEGQRKGQKERYS